MTLSRAHGAWEDTARARLDLQQRGKSALFVIHVEYATLEADDVPPAAASDTVGESFEQRIGFGRGFTNS